jgi:hypothetical protein
MKLLGIVSATVLSLTLGAAAPAYTQQEQHDQQEEQKDKPAKPAKDETKTTPGKPAKQEDKTARPPDQNAKQEEKAAQQPDQKAAQQQQPQHTQQAKPGQQAQRSGGNGGGRIPDDRFQANFGREHAFRVNQGDYSRDRRFQYGGYSFEFVDSWPANWLYTQDVFVVYIDGGYYLCNPMYPGVNIALSLRL